MKQPELIIEDLLPQGRPVEATTKELRALADDIHVNGLVHPVLVVDGVVIDGLKRIEAFKLLGRARIPAMITSNFGEACLFLEKVRDGAQLDVPRAIQIIEQLEPTRQFYHRLRYLPMLARDNKSKPWAKYSTRQLAARAIGYSESYTEAILLILRHASSDEELSRRLSLIRQGRDTVHGAYRSYMRKRPLQDYSGAKPEEIRTTVSRGLQTMDTTIEAIGKYGNMATLPRDERAEIVAQLNQVKTNLFQVVKEIKEFLQVEAKEGSEG